MARTILHGSLVAFEGSGVLILGNSGSGKTRCALDLVSLGGKLVADDVVEIESRGERLFGSAPERFRGHFAYGGSIYSLENSRNRAIATECEIEVFIDLSDRYKRSTELLGILVPAIEGRTGEPPAEPLEELFRTEVTDAFFAVHDARFCRREPLDAEKAK